jgi:hypothetical protein
MKYWVYVLDFSCGCRYNIDSSVLLLNKEIVQAKTPDNAVRIIA